MQTEKVVNGHLEMETVLIVSHSSVSRYLITYIVDKYCLFIRDTVLPANSNRYLSSARSPLTNQ
jgi:hypothetical protein